MSRHTAISGTVGEVSGTTGTSVKHTDTAAERAPAQRAGGLAPANGHDEWSPPADRPDPVATLLSQDASRDQDLVPIRHGRMMASAFAFYRGGAKIMAIDLGAMPSSGLIVQLCGDAHLSNFGAFASPERELLFDVNDFDETLPGPFEYDVKRLGASFAICARTNGFAKRDARKATTEVGASYRSAMAGFARMGIMPTWYAHLDSQELLASIKAPGAAPKKGSKQALLTAQKSIKKACTRDAVQAMSSLCEVVDGTYRIASKPPVIVPLRELGGDYGVTPDHVEQFIRSELHDYRQSLRDDLRQLLDRFEYVDAARKVVGVGSVGTRCFIALLRGRHDQDPLFLQIKEAGPSVLEDTLGPSSYANPGERVVQGQRLMQSASDILLGWTTGVQQGRTFYWRQLHDMKGSLDVEAATPAGLMVYARLCGWALARAHARSGDPMAIAAYLGSTDAFESAIARFAERYADQNESDYQEFLAAIRAGRVEARPGV